MARPLRIEFPGALYHLTSRGNNGQPIYLGDEDRLHFLEELARTCDRHAWLCHAYCLMDNHYHLLVETLEPTLSRGMKYLNGIYTQGFNKRHNRLGHVFQGRFKGILVDGNAYLLEVARYIALNPVRAGMVQAPDEWPWSSYKATAGMASPHPCLTTNWVLSVFGETKSGAYQRYRDFVAQGASHPSPWKSLKNQIYLGSDRFMRDMLEKLDPNQPLDDIPKVQKSTPSKPLQYYCDHIGDRKRAMAIAYLDGHHTLQKIGNYFGVSCATVSRAVKQHEKCKT